MTIRVFAASMGFRGIPPSNGSLKVLWSQKSELRFSRKLPFLTPGKGTFEISGKEPYGLMKESFIY